MGAVISGRYYNEKESLKLARRPRQGEGAESLEAGGRLAGRRANTDSEALHTRSRLSGVFSNEGAPACQYNILWVKTSYPLGLVLYSKTTRPFFSWSPAAIHF